MAIGDKLFIADKPTLDAVKLDTTRILKNQPDNIILKDVTGFDKTKLLRNSSTNIITTHFINNYLIQFDRQGRVVKVFDMDSKEVSSLTLSGWTMLDYGFIDLGNNKILIKGLAPTPNNLALKILDLGNLQFGSDFFAGLGSSTVECISFANNNIYVETFSSGVRDLWSASVDLVNLKLSNWAPVVNSVHLAYRICDINFNTQSGKYLVLTINGLLFETGDLKTLINSSFATYDSKIVVPVPASSDTDRSWVYGFVGSKIVNNGLYYLPTFDSASNSPAYSPAPVGVDLGLKGLFKQSQFASSAFVPFFSSCHVSSIDYNNKPYYTGFGYRREANSPPSLMLLISSINTKGEVRTLKYYIGDTIMSLTSKANAPYFRATPIMYGESIILNVEIIDQSDSSYFKSTFERIDITSLIKEVEEACL